MDIAYRGKAIIDRIPSAEVQGRMTLAEAYTVGQTYMLMTASGEAASKKDWPAWVKSLDPAEVLFRGAMFESTADPFAFANCCDEWLRALAAEGFRGELENLAREAIAVSERFAYPLGSTEVVFVLGQRLTAMGLDERRLPLPLMPHVFLGTTQAFKQVLPGPLPDSPPGADRMVAEFWRDVENRQANDGSVRDALQLGLRFARDSGFTPQAPVHLLAPLYLTIVGPLEPEADELGVQSGGWAMGLAPDSPCAVVTAALITADTRGLTIDEALERLFALPEFGAQVREEDRLLRRAPGTALDRLIRHLGLG